VRGPPSAAGPALRIVQVGFATTLQDRGRIGYGHLGVPSAGPVDRWSAALADRLVGNPLDGDPPAGGAMLETLGGLVVEATRPVLVARSTDASRHTLAAGERIRVDAPAGQVWAYLAVRGGIDVEPVLGSRSHDTLSGLGPPSLAVGDELPAGADPGTELVVDHAAVRRSGAAVRLWDGPQHDWFVGGPEQLIGRPWAVSRDVSRVGVRLEADEFEPSPQWRPSMASIGLVEGAVQITPAGEPIVMLADHPTTGGYPVIAVVDPVDLPTLVQTPPGATVRFRRR